MGRRFVGRSLLVLLAASAGVIWARDCPGCIDRARVNTRCEWTGRGTLLADAQLAEELAIRYADAEFNRQYGSDGHGGLEGRTRNTCMARLVTAIEQHHGVAAAQIAEARAQRDPIFDAAAALSFVPLYVFGAAIAGRLLDRRFATERPAVKSIAAVLMSVAGSFLGLQVGQLWLGVWETVRVRNGHISVFRAASRTVWTHQHAWMLFFAGIVVCWSVVRTRRRLAALEDWIRGAAMAAGTALAAMFAEVFVQHAAGYALVAVALVMFLSIVSRLDAAPDATPVVVLLH